MQLSQQVAPSIGQAFHRRAVAGTQRFGPHGVRHGAGGPGAPAAAPPENVRAAAGVRVHRSVPVPGGDPEPAASGGDRVPAKQQAEEPQAAGHPAELRPTGLQLLPGGPGRLQLDPG